jgi:hypothetical protein
VTAHVRRTNPRDALVASPEQSWLVVNRHRILRRGRVYGDFLQEDQLEDDGKDRGLFFMCVNANIARQFEFMQQTWVENPKFGGLSQDTDPLIGGPGEARHTLTMPERPVRARSVGIPSFVEVRGGAYLFLPSLSAIGALVVLTGPPRSPQGKAKARQAETVAQ